MSVRFTPLIYKCIVTCNAKLLIFDVSTIFIAFELCRIHFGLLFIHDEIEFIPSIRVYCHKRGINIQILKFHAFVEY